MLIEVNDNNFEELVCRSSKPAFVAFTADWCWVCDNYKKELEQLHELVGHQVGVYLLDIDRSPDMKQYHNIQGTPTSVLYNKGEEVAQLDGAWPVSVLIQFLEDKLGDDFCTPQVQSYQNEW